MEYSRKEINIAGIRRNTFHRGMNFVPFSKNKRSYWDQLNGNSSLSSPVQRNGTEWKWIESERTNERVTTHGEMLEKWKKKKKQKLSSVERLLERWIEWTFDGIFERFYRAGWCSSPVCAYTRCSIVFANIYFRHVAAISRGQYGRDSAFMLRANTKTTTKPKTEEAAKRRNNNKRFSFTSCLLFLPPFQQQFDKRFLSNSMETTLLLLI